MAAGDALDIVKAALRISRYDDALASAQTDGLYWLNECHRSILSDGYPWSFLNFTGQMALVAGQQRYTFSSLATALGVANIERVLWVVNDTLGSVPMKGMGSEDLERLSYSTQNDPQGDPIGFTQIGLGSQSPTILFYPTPDKAYTVGTTVRLGVVDLTTTDFPLLPRTHAPAVLVPYIAARMWQQRAGPDAANEAMAHDARHELAKRRLIQSYASTNEEEVVFADPTMWDHIDFGGGSW